LPEIEVSHFKGSIWLTTSLEGVAIARGTALCVLCMTGS
jgi:hypothetical protein